MLIVKYQHNRDRKICEDTKRAIRVLGSRAGKQLTELIVLLKNVKDLSDVAMMPQYRLHKLKGDLKDKYSMSLPGTGIRIEFYPMDENENVLLSGNDEAEMFRNTKIVLITEVSDHYE